jgi:hypothetical protein
VDGMQDLVFGNASVGVSQENIFQRQR